MKRTLNTYRTCLIGLLLGLSIFVYGQKPEYIIKTAYIEKFVNYIEWPNQHNANDVFTIAVVGDIELYKIITKAFSNRKIKNKKVRVTYFDEVDEIKMPDLLVLISSRSKDLETAIELCEKRKFLIVSDSDGFARKGAHINFYLTAEQTIHFEMNKSSLDRDNFNVEFLLLDFAKVVKN